MIKIRWSWLTAAITCFLFMLVLGSLPGNAQALTEKINDKVLHFLAYSVLTTLIYLSIHATKLEKIIITLSLMLAFSVFDEFIQSLLSFRHATLSDLAIDLLAATLMTCCLNLLNGDTECKWHS